MCVEGKGGGGITQVLCCACLMVSVQYNTEFKCTIRLVNDSAIIAPVTCAQKTMEPTVHTAETLLTQRIVNTTVDVQGVCHIFVDRMQVL